MTAMRKCRYQLDDCDNWTDSGLTLGYGQVWDGPKDAAGRSTLVNVPVPICPQCLARNPYPHQANPDLVTVS